MSENNNINVAALRIVEIIIRIGIGFVLVYVAFGLLHLIVNGSKGRTDFPIPPVLMILSAAAFLMHQSFANIRRGKKQIKPSKADIENWLSETFSKESKKFLVATIGVTICLVINVLTETFGTEAFILIAILGAFLSLVIIYLQFLPKKLKQNR